MSISVIIQWIVIVVLIGMLVKIFMPVKGVDNITVADIKQMRKNKQNQFVDVRTSGEFKRNHQKPFKNIPLSELANRTKELQKDQEVVVICQSGMRSMKGAKILKKQGFAKISNVKGGISAW